MNTSGDDVLTAASLRDQARSFAEDGKFVDAHRALERALDLHSRHDREENALTVMVEAQINLLQGKTGDAEHGFISALQSLRGLGHLDEAARGAIRDCRWGLLLTQLEVGGIDEIKAEAARLVAGTLADRKFVYDVHEGDVVRLDVAEALAASKRWNFPRRRDHYRKQFGRKSW